jgi:hypothetical protein
MTVAPRIGQLCMFFIAVVGQGASVIRVPFVGCGSTLFVTPQPIQRYDLSSVAGGAIHVAILQGDTPDLLLLTVRLPPDMYDLTSHIIQQVERDDAESQFRK